MHLLFEVKSLCVIKLRVLVLHGESYFNLRWFLFILACHLALWLGEKVVPVSPTASVPERFAGLGRMIVIPPVDGSSAHPNFRRHPATLRGVFFDAYSRHWAAVAGIVNIITWINIPCMAICDSGFTDHPDATVHCLAH
jgi:hypothetical protein